VEPEDLATSTWKLEEWKYGSWKPATLEPGTLETLGPVPEPEKKTKQHTENVSNTNIWSLGVKPLEFQTKREQDLKD